jgi:hypothetical protein
MERQVNTVGRVRSVKPTSARPGRTLADPMPALQTVLSETVNFLVAAGLSRAEAARQLENQRRRVLSRKRGARSRSAAEVGIEKQERQLLGVSGVVHDWHRDERYTDERGEPSSLTQGQLVALISTRFGPNRAGAALAWMLDNRVVRRSRDKRFELVRGRSVLVRDKALQSQTLARAAVIVPQYLQLILRNAATADLESRELERDARVLFLPEKYVPLWRSLVRERVQEFLESMDNWLEDHASVEDGESVREVGIHVHCHIGELKAPDIDQ